ncbi:MAG: hypothetical protein ACI9CE_001242 [Flavobacterium sp.]|jgi:hypothetical protein
MNCFYYQYLLPTGQLRTSITKLSFASEASAKLYMEQRWIAVIIKSVMLPIWFNVFYDMFSPLVKKRYNEMSWWIFSVISR